MKNQSPPLLQTLTPERFAGWSMDFIDAGYTGLLVKNGKVMRTLIPGRHFSFALPWLDKCNLILVDTKLRNLSVTSQGDFLSKDQFLLNISLNIVYQVIDPVRVALELSDPIAALTSAVKDSLGMTVGHLHVNQLVNNGRVLIREYLLNHAETSYTLGFSLEDVRVSDINFPKTKGVIRQVEGLSAREEAEYQARLQAQVAEAGRPAIAPPVQQVNVIPAHKVISEKVVQIEGSTNQTAASLPQDTPVLAPTILAANNENFASLIHQASGNVISIQANPFTIGREPISSLVLQDPQCSRRHAQIKQITQNNGETRYQLIDLGSSNGTFVDEQKLTANQPFWLSSGQVIRIGHQKWTFEV
ncbi:MAG: FHA domain-containing protein [Oscillatoria sp. PMC 1068.18]|nr:FHA domain-containing protein [Oscillatoria sp. PMC 1076.18]MEC4987212.1 FHA domain-containing protein [Oscillatoria sp. PMC 1068.18]